MAQAGFGEKMQEKNYICTELEAKDDISKPKDDLYNCTQTLCALKAQPNLGRTLSIRNIRISEDKNHLFQNLISL